MEPSISEFKLLRDLPAKASGTDWLTRDRATYLWRHSVEQPKRRRDGSLRVMPANGLAPAFRRVGAKLVAVHVPTLARLVAANDGRAHRDGESETAR